MTLRYGSSMKINRDWEGAMQSFNAALATAKREDNPWMTVGERIAKADLARAARDAKTSRELVSIIAEGIKVLPGLDEDRAFERARNIAMGILGNYRVERIEP
jgi:hypothetical protein